MKQKNFYFLGLLLISVIIINSCVGGGGGGGDDEENFPVNYPDYLGDYIVLSWNDLGIHCLDKDFSVFSILPPYNTLHAQVIRRGGEPQILNDTVVNVFYQAQADADGTINTTSVGKTNFWDYVRPLFNVSLPPDVGLKNYPTQSYTPVGMEFDLKYNFFKAEGIPTAPYDDNGNFDPYPLAKITATDKNGNLLASATAVIPVSDEMSCITCHASNSGNSEALPKNPANHLDPEIDYRLNILLKHDDNEETKITQAMLDELKAQGYNYQASLYQTQQDGTPILCAACHKSNALGTNGVSGVPPLTQAIHSSHALPVQNTGKTGTDACYLCHPGTKTQCLRGAMGSNGIACQNCHGDMAQVDDINREGWLDMPNCQSCHQQGQRYTSVFDSNGNPRPILDDRFATNPDTPLPGKSLYRLSKGHGGLQCEACHGPTHAIYPSREPKDNQHIVALQGYKGELRECWVCHSNQVPLTSNGGPHGLHTIGQAWVNAHGDIVERNGSTSCAYCHGSDYRGTPLSEIKTTKTFATEWGNKTFTAGHQVSCYDCHNGPNGD
jgi:hypothetical protein